MPLRIWDDVRFGVSFGDEVFLLQGVAIYLMVQNSTGVADGDGSVLCFRACSMRMVRSPMAWSSEAVVLGLGGEAQERFRILVEFVFHSE